MDAELTDSHHERPRKVALLARRQGRKTPLARRRRLYALVRELAGDLGFDLERVTRSERAVLHQSATLLLQIEVAQDQLVGGAVIDADVCIRLTSEARRLLTGLRKRVGQDAPRTPPPWSPLRARLNAAAKAPAPSVAEVTPEPEAAS